MTRRGGGERGEINTIANYIDWLGCTEEKNYLSAHKLLAQYTQIPLADESNPEFL